MLGEVVLVQGYSRCSIARYRELDYSVAGESLVLTNSGSIGLSLQDVH